MYRRKALAGAALVAVLVPALAFAETTTDTQSQIQSLMSQIQTLQKQLIALLGTTTPRGDHSMTWNASSTPPMGNGGPGQMGKMLCIMLNRNIGPGSRGDDVKNLQQMLAQDPTLGFTASSTGVFGSLTARAMMMFQRNNGITPSNDGSVGPLTRGLLQRRCGNGLGDREGSMGTSSPKMDDHKLPMQGQGQGMMLPKNTVIGTVSAVSGSSFTLQNKDGNKTATVNVVASTTIEVGKTDSTAAHTGTTADLTVGQTVMVQGSQNGDGTYNAYHIRVGTLPPMPTNAGSVNHGYQNTNSSSGSNNNSGNNGWEWNQSQPGSAPH